MIGRGIWRYRLATVTTVLGLVALGACADDGTPRPDTGAPSESGSAPAATVAIDATRPADATTVADLASTPRSAVPAGTAATPTPGQDRAMAVERDLECRSPGR